MLPSARGRYIESFDSYQEAVSNLPMYQVLLEHNGEADEWKLRVARRLLCISKSTKEPYFIPDIIIEAIPREREGENDVKQVLTTLVDDLDGSSEADETVRFSLDGTDFEIDLTTDHAAELRALLGEYTGAARSGRHLSAVPSAGRSRAGERERKVRTKAIRDWAAGMRRMDPNFPRVAERGAIPRALAAAYDAARGELPEPPPPPLAAVPDAEPVKKTAAKKPPAAKKATERPPAGGPVKKTAAARRGGGPAAVPAVKSTT